jgi:hypothetical protein
MTNCFLAHPFSGTLAEPTAMKVEDKTGLMNNNQMRLSFAALIALLVAGKMVAVEKPLMRGRSG